MTNKSMYLINEVVPYQLGFQTPASPYMHGIVNLHHHIMFYLVMVLCFTFTMLYFTLKTFTINYTNNFKKYSQIKLLYNIRFKHHALLDIIWTVVPTIILLLIAIPSFALLYSFDYTVKVPHTILEVVGHQWYWSYEYNILINGTKNNEISTLKVPSHFQFDSYMVPTEELKTGQLRLLSTTAPVVLPIGQFVKCLITADDVLHSWAIPALGVKIDAMPGRSSSTYIYMEAPGVYYGQCSELCGVNHGFMPIEIHGVNSIEFDLWAYLKLIEAKEDNVNNLDLETIAQHSFILMAAPLFFDSNIFMNKTKLIEVLGSENFDTLVKNWKEFYPMVNNMERTYWIVENASKIFDKEFHYDYKFKNIEE